MFSTSCLMFGLIVSIQARVSIHIPNVIDTKLSNEISIKDKIKITFNSNDPVLKTHNAKIEVANAIPGPAIIQNEKKNISSNIIDTDEPFVSQKKIDNGTALILTKFIKDGEIKKGQLASRVDPSLFLGFESYSGFLTVNETYNSNMFFWYFPAVKPENGTPWIIWLQGGPGASSMTGLFDEIGPFKFVNDGLVLNPNSWVYNQSLVFIDNPIGSGYSFTDHKDGFVQDMETYGMHMYIAVKQLVQLFPELSAAPLFVAGESYAGKYVPALATQIHRHKQESGPNINLQGIIVGNGYVDPHVISQLTMSFYYFGMLAQEQLDTIKPLTDSFQLAITQNNSLVAKEKWSNLVTTLLLSTGQSQIYNFLLDDLSVGKYVKFLKRSEVKRALHVGDINFYYVNLTVNTKLAPDFLSNAKPLYETLLEHYKVLVYCGQLDQMVPCMFLSDNYRTWKWSESQEFTAHTRFPFVYNNTVSGWLKSGGRLTEVIFRNAGHMVPIDAPHASRHVVEHWIRNQPVAKRFNFNNDFIKRFVYNHTAVHYL